MLSQQGQDPFHALACQPLLAITEQFVLSTSLEEKLRHDLQHLALIPKLTRTLKNRWMQQMGHPLLLSGGKSMDFAKAWAGPIISHDALDERVKYAVAHGQLRAQKLGREFDGDETMAIPGLSPCPQLVIPRQIKSRRQWFEVNGFFRAMNRAVAGQIQTKLQAAGVKTA